jgi:hypothetical protein
MSDDPTAFDDGHFRTVHRRIRRRRVEEVGPELVHHLFVGKRAERAEPPEVTQVDRGEPGRLDRVQIPAASLHEQRLDAVAHERRHGALERRVPAAVHDERGIATDQPRGVHTERHRLAPARGEPFDPLGGFAIGPAALHRARVGGGALAFQPMAAITSSVRRKSSRSA